MWRNIKTRYNATRQIVYQRLLHHAQTMSPTTFAAAIAVGVYIALSPLLGIQTIAAFCIARFCKLPSALVIGVTYAINNPWSMIPIIALDYVIGKHTLALFFTDNSRIWTNPTWFITIENFIKNNLSIPTPSLAAYLLGGNLVGIMCAIPTYFFFHKIALRWQK